jgi:WD40 repeat protein
MNSFYKVGGSLDETHPTYIKRQADEDLHANLLAGNFCYVLTSRQMGKSSLRVRVKKRLEEDGFGCSSIDLTEIGSHNITASQWYYAILDRLIVDLELTEVVDLDDLWVQYQNLAPLQRLNKFVTTILFAHITTPIVIFVDEIDSIIDLKFDTDDFFAWIRYCYNFRTDNLDYKRLTFCLLGVATPTDLIRNKSRTSYNIGESVEPLRFQEIQLNPLMAGLQEHVMDLERVQHEIHKWTGGQPLLTQRLCKLIQSDLERIELGQEEELIAKLVESKIIENWESQDKQSHLQTIRDRLLKDEDKAVSLLGLYQQILESMESKESIEVGNNLSEVMALRLTGLVVSEEGRLFVYNQIYQRVFSAAWVAQELAKLRPYAVSLVQWLVNRDDRYLLTGQGFLDAQQWSLTRQLTREDSQYLAASQKLHTEDFQAQAEEVINKAKKRATLFSAIGVSGLIGSVIASGIAFFNFNETIWRTRIEQASTEALSTSSEKSLERTITAIRVGRQLQQRVKDEHINNYPTYSPLTALRQATTNNWYESNRFSLGKDESILAMSANAKTIISSSKDGTAKILKQDGSFITKLNDIVLNASISDDGKTILSNAACHESGDPATKGYDEYSYDLHCSTFSRIIKIWRLDGSLASTIKHQSSITSMRVSGDGKIIAAGDKDGIINIWRQDGSLISSFKAHKSRVTYLKLNTDGRSILSTSNVGKITKLHKQDGSLIFAIKNKDFFAGIDISNNGQTIASFDLNNMFDYTSDDFFYGDSGKYKSSEKVKDGKIKLWRRDGSPANTIITNIQSQNSVSMSSDSKIIASAGTNQNIQVWNRDGSLVDTFPGKEKILSIKVSTNGQTIISRSRRTVKIWRKNNSLNSTFDNHKNIVSSVGISTDSQTIVSGSNDKIVNLWNRNGSLLQTLIGHKSSVNSVAVSTDGQTIISGSKDRTVKLWSKNSSLLTSSRDAEASIYDVGISGDGKSIIFNSGYGNAKVQKPDGSDITTIKNNVKYELLSVALSADGQTIVSATGKYNGFIPADIFEKRENKIQLRPLKIWRRDGTLITTLASDQDGVNSVGISADGQIIIAGIDDGTVKVWRRDGTLIKTVTAHQRAVNGVAISADGKTIVSGGNDNLVKVWRQDGTLIATLTGHQASITSVGISGDGKTIVSGSYDKTVRVWHFDLDYLLAKGCEQIEDYLNTHPKVNRDELCPVLLKGEIAR